MMKILHKLRNGNLTKNDLGLVRDINNTIYRSPRPNYRFKTLRGIYGDQDHLLGKGDITITNSPKSGSFFIDHITAGYINSTADTRCCVAHIYIPRESIMSYHRSEDQVIFPTGAIFFVLTDPWSREYLNWGNSTNITSYQFIYIDAPLEPQALDTSSGTYILEEGSPDPTNLYTLLSFADAYLLCFLRDIPFPYGYDPFGLLLKEDQRDARFINRITSGKYDIDSALEMRLYLASLGHDIKSHISYNAEEMRIVLREMGLLA